MPSGRARSCRLRVVVAEHPDEATRHTVAGRLVAGDGEEPEEVLELLDRHRAAEIVALAHEDRHDVLAAAAGSAVPAAGCPSACA
jgi:hypothetical protein